MSPPFPSPVPTWHNDTYARISPQREMLSQIGKTIIVTGAGSGIGRETVAAFAAAGAEHIHIIGRTEATLLETKSLVHGNSKVSVHAADVNDIEAMTRLASEIGTWNVFIMNAGYVAAPAQIREADLEEYWKCYEINVRSIIVFAKAFLPTASTERPVLIGNTAGGICLPVEYTSGSSPYFTSKLAQVRTLEYLAAENPSLHVVSVQPGVVETTMLAKSGFGARDLPLDSVTLPAHYMLWLASPEAAFLRGRFVWSNWDVDELMAMKNEIKEKNWMVTAIAGWPFAHGGS